MAKSGELTDKQREILEYMKECILNKGYPPAVREICEAVHLKSTSSVHAHLESLEQKGYIRKDPTKPRAIEILDDNFNLSRREVVNIPIVGTVTCGEPILAEQNIEDFFPVLPNYLNARGTTFMLKVKGDSMVNVGIYDGDLVMVEESNTARNNDIVVALIEDEATVKRYFKENGHYRLQPENDFMDPIIVDELSILGKVVGLFRRM
jgi:repressor LexA